MTPLKVQARRRSSRLGCRMTSGHFLHSFRLRTLIDIALSSSRLILNYFLFTLCSWLRNCQKWTSVLFELKSVKMSSFDFNDSIDWFNQSLSSDVLDSTPMNWLLLPVGAALAMIVALTIGGNVLILSAVCTNCNLREPTHILIANLAVADLLLGFLVLPFSATLEVTCYIFCSILQS